MGKRAEIECIKDFLRICRQRVIISDVNSEWREVLSWVPQGSVWSVLFVIYINDNIENLKSEAYCFADDKEIFRLINDENVDMSYLQNDVDLVDQWTCTWLLNLNNNKCKKLQYLVNTTNPLSIEATH